MSYLPSFDLVTDPLFVLDLSGEDDGIVETLLHLYCRAAFDQLEPSCCLVITEPEYRLAESARQLMETSCGIYNTGQLN